MCCITLDQLFGMLWHSHRIRNHLIVLLETALVLMSAVLLETALVLTSALTTKIVNTLQHYNILNDVYYIITYQI